MVVGRFDLWTLIGLVVLAGLIVAWEVSFNTDPRVNPHPFIIRRFEPEWDDWDALTWDQKMQIFRRRQIVHWGFIVIVGALWVGLFLLGALQRGGPL